MPAKAQPHFHGVRPRDHYMPLQRLTIGASHASYSSPNLKLPTVPTCSIPDTWWHMLSYGVYSLEPVLS
jgi:hypothetical protein